MPAFDAGAFSAAFDAEVPDITTAVHRAVLEVLADLGAATVHRVTAEAVAVATGVRVLRGTTEVIKEHIPSLMGVHRTVVEVLRPDTFELPDTKPRVRRSVAEVLAWALPNGYRLRTLRTASELIGTANAAHRGLRLPSIAAGSFSGYMAFTPDTTQDGSLGLLTAQGEGLLVRWDAGGTELTLNWRQGGNDITWAQALVPGVQIVHYAAETPGLVLAELGLTRPEGFSGPVTVHEVLVLDDPLPGAELRVQRYLEARWQGAGANDPCALYGPGVTTRRVSLEVIRVPDADPTTRWRISPALTPEGASFIAPEYAAYLGMPPAGDSDPLFSLDSGGVLAVQFLPEYPIYNVIFFTPDVGRTDAVPIVLVNGEAAAVDSVGILDAVDAGLPWPGSVAIVGLSGVPPLTEGPIIDADITWT